MNFFDVLNKYKYWKENSVKSILGEFSSAVSIFRNKGTQSNLSAPFLPGRGVWGPFLRLCAGVQCRSIRLFGSTYRSVHCRVRLGPYAWWNNNWAHKARFYGASRAKEGTTTLRKVVFLTMMQPRIASPGAPQGSLLTRCTPTSLGKTINTVTCFLQNCDYMSMSTKNFIAGTYPGLPV